MKRFAFALLLSTLLVAPALARMPMGSMPDMPGPPMGMSMGEHMGPDLMAACMADLNDLGLSAETRKGLEEKRFDLKKKAIRGMADLRILRMEASHLLESRTFDAKAAEAKFNEISQKEAELQVLHLGFLRELGAALTDEQWKALREKRMEGMPMMGGMMMEGMGKGEMPKNCMPMDCMKKGDKGDDCMMDEMKDEHADHHHSNKEDATKFFEEKK